MNGGEGSPKKEDVSDGLLLSKMRLFVMQAHLSGSEEEWTFFLCSKSTRAQGARCCEKRHLPTVAHTSRRKQSDEEPSTLLARDDSLCSHSQKAGGSLFHFPDRRAAASCVSFLARSSQRRSHH